MSKLLNRGSKMNKLVILVALMMSLSISRDLACQSLLGTIYRDIRTVPELSGFNKDAGMLIENSDYSVSLLHKEQLMLALIEEVIPRSGSNPMRFKIIDTFEKVVDIRSYWTCDSFLQLIGIVHMQGDVELIDYVWKLRISGNKILLDEMPASKYEIREDIGGIEYIGD